MMESWGESTSLTTKALDSNGFALERQAIYLESTKAKIQQYKTTIDIAWQNMLSTEGMNVFIQGATALAETFLNIPSIIGIATLTLIAFKSSAISTALATNGLTTSIKLLGVAIMSNPVGLAIAGITAVVGGYMLWQNHAKKTKEREEELSRVRNDNLANFRENADKNKKAYEDVNKLLEEQSKILENVKINKATNDEKQRLHDLEVMIAKSVPEATNAFDGENQAMATNMDLTKKLIALKKEEADTESLAVISSIDIDKEIENTYRFKMFIEEITDMINNPKLDNTIIMDFFNENISRFTDEEKKSILAEGINNQVLGTILSDRNKKYQESKKVLMDYNSANEYRASQGLSNKKAVDMSVFGIETLTSVEKEAIKTSEQLTQSEDERAESMANLEKTYDSSIDKMGFYAKALKEIDTNGHLSSSTTKEIAKDYKDLAPLLDDMPALYQKIKGEMASQATVAKDTYERITMLDKNFIALTEKLKSEGYKTDFKNATNLAKAKIALEAETIRIIAGAWSEYMDKQGKVTWDTFGADEGITGGEDGIPQMSGAKANDIKRLKEMQDAIAKKNKENADALKGFEPKIDFSKLGGDLEGTTKVGKDGGSSKEDIANLDLKTDRYYKLNSALQSVETELSKLNSLESNATESEKLKFKEKEIALLDQKKLALQAIYREQEKENQSNADKLKSQGAKFDNQGNIVNRNELLTSKTNSANSKTGDAKKTSQESVKQFEEDLKNYEDLRFSKITDTSSKIFTLEQDRINKLAELEISKFNNKLENIEKSYGKESQQIEDIKYSLDEINAKGDDSKDTIARKVKLTEDLIKATEDYNIRLLTGYGESLELLKTQKQGTEEWDKANLKVEDFKEKLKDTNIEMINIVKSQKDLTMSQIQSLIESQKAIAEITLKQQQENEKTSLASSIYGVSGESAEAIKEAYDKQNQTIIDGIDKQIQLLEDKADVENESIERLKNQTDLQEKLNNLEEVQNERNIKQLTKQSDGSFQFEFVVDASAVKSAQDAVNDQIKSNQDFEKSTALKHQIETLNDLKKSFADQKEAKDKDYAERLAILESHQLIETNLMTLHYSDINILADAKLKDLKAIYGDNWKGIIDQLTTDVASAKTLQDSLLLAQANGTLGLAVKGGTPNTPNGSEKYDMAGFYADPKYKILEQAFLEAKRTDNLNVLDGLNSQAEELKKKYKRYANGGLVNYTGMAYVDGTPSKPEAFLNPIQTENIGKLGKLLDSNLLLNIQDFQKNMMLNIPKFNMPDMSNLTKSNSPIINEYTFTGDLKFDNMTNGANVSDFVKELNAQKNFKIRG
jgi:hypothetical protein